MTIQVKKSKLESSQTKEELMSRTVSAEEDIANPGLTLSGNSLAEDKIFQFPPQQRGRSNSLAKNMGDLARKLDNNDNGLTATTSYTSSGSQTLWDDCGDPPDSQRSSPAPLEQDLRSHPAPLRPSSGDCSPRDRSSSLGAIWSGLSPRGIQDYSGLSEPYEDYIGPNTYDRVARKPLGARPSRWQPLTPTGSSVFSDESSKFVGRSSLDIDNAAREHPLYHDVTPKADGLYHCPWEDDPKTNCVHKPEKLKCNYDKFVDSHLQPYRCKVVTCKDLRFSSTACLLRHEREAHAMHGHGDKPFTCTYEGCERGVPGNGFPRHWNLRDHMKRVHNDTWHPPKSNASGSSPLSPPGRRGKKRKADDNSRGTIATSSRKEKSTQEASLAERETEKN